MPSKSYANRSSANRAAKKAGLTEGQFEVKQVWEEEGKSHWEWFPKDTTTAPTNPAPVATTTETAPATQSAAEQTPSPAAAPTRSNIKAAKSTVESPVKVVWAIAEEMKKANPQATRKQIVDACLAKGVAYYTARTQYQRWAKSKKTP